jgi:hypothetical protein
MIGYNIYNCQFSYDLLQQCSELQYCISCHSTKNSFGCFGLKQKRNCILNKQYSEADYLALRQKIIARMKADGEYGAFFPMEMSPHGYNETMADAWYPKSAQEVKEKGWHWEQRLPFTKGKATLAEIPDNTADVDDSITKEVLCCQQCQRDYRIVSQELRFYKKHGFPLPEECFQCRRTRRMSQRDARKFWDRKCDNCAGEIKTTIEPKRVQKVFCEKCYLDRAY